MANNRTKTARPPKSIPIIALRLKSAWRRIAPIGTASIGTAINTHAMVSSKYS
jgi:hypothetical protein